jgi:hypothetical protein
MSHNKKDELGLKSIPDPKVTIYVATAQEIFEQSFIKARSLSENGKVVSDKVLRRANQFFTLAGELSKIYADSPVTEEYLRTKVREIKILTENQRPYQTIGFDHHELLTLATFAGFPNYNNLDRKFGPVIKKKVWFSQKPFKFLQLIRVPSSGEITEIDNTWIYEDTGNDKKISGNVVEVQPYTMPGDRSPLWLAVTYHNQGAPVVAYFAEYTNSGIKAVTDSNELLLFFEKLKNGLRILD